MIDRIGTHVYNSLFIALSRSALNAIRKRLGLERLPNAKVEDQ
jgi:hypothetical protein